ncbi:MAG: class I SAM-dependent methyltransferase [Candidatus Omnitrophica bacterium]|nr:class I SAM-dependent methyltransferase [Candidatus Omnitrophota bacterium]MBU1997537.1 class I SAM-dependent methyltransferase [Candidatus Omnitrophota bacterium]MBU4334747.1 class I SAM-dependent methyltransferase [Candidatus Omnitrophota bacterium]
MGIGQLKEKLIVKLLVRSLNTASKEQGLLGIRDKLDAIVEDITSQYTNKKIEGEYLTAKVRSLHAFQISLIEKAIAEFKDAVVVDIGDSSGVHIQYIKSLFKENCSRCLSVNLDEKAVKKIKDKGLEAILSRAEELDKYNINGDIFMSFEMLEHLMNPARFLYDLSSKSDAKYLVITVPYKSASKVGLRWVREEIRERSYAENTHIFELSPEDWKMLFKFSGWKVNYEQVYRQYPNRHVLRALKGFWKKHDYEGFYGVILEKDDTYSSLYSDWQ